MLNVMDLNRVQRVGSYSVFTFLPLDNLYFGIYELGKERTESYSSSERLRTERVDLRIVVC